MHIGAVSDEAKRDGTFHGAGVTHDCEFCNMGAGN